MDGTLECTKAKRNANIFLMGKTDEDLDVYVKETLKLM
jgi:hypothetical protein